MYIIIGGGGQVGFYLTKALLTQGHEVLLVEKDNQRYDLLKEDLGTSIIHGDACEASTMQEIGSNRADIMIAVTGDDEDNLVICQMAKHSFNVSRTIARINNPKNEPVFIKLGIDVTVSPTNTILHLIEAEIPHYNLVPLMNITKAGLEIVELTVPEGSPVVNKSLRDINLPRSYNFVLINRREESIVPNGDTVLQANDQIFALVTQQGEEALRALVLGTSVPS